MSVVGDDSLPSVKERFIASEKLRLEALQAKARGPWQKRARAGLTPLLKAAGLVAVIAAALCAGSGLLVFCVRLGWRLAEAVVQ